MTIKLTRKDERRAPKHIRMKLLNQMWHDREIPDDAFVDDPRAENFDKNGKASSSSSSDLPTNRWDLGTFPPNE